MSDLAYAVLPLIRTRADLHRRGAANQHGRQMQQALDILEAAAEPGEAKDVHTVTHKALTSAITVIARADDSSGIIGDACRRLLELHPVTAAAAKVSPTKLANWMVTFQLDGVVDYFRARPARYRDLLTEREAALPPDLTEAEKEYLTQPIHRDPDLEHRWSVNRRAKHVLKWNAQRLAVHGRDIKAMIRTHLRGGRVPAWHEATAKALAEIEAYDEAIDYAHQAVNHPTGGYQAMTARRT